jgi:hypothetical protein
MPSAFPRPDPLIDVHTTTLTRSYASQCSPLSLNQDLTRAKARTPLPIQTHSTHHDDANTRQPPPARPRTTPRAHHGTKKPLNTSNHASALPHDSS